MNNLKKDFASRLLKVKAIKLQPNDPFTWASGWKSPFYCDNRKTLAYPELRTFVKLELVHAVLENFSEAEAVAGVATVFLSLTYVRNQRIMVWQTSSKAK